MSILGAILGNGIIDGGGRNVTISLYNRYSNTKHQSSIIGMAIFWQYWYWYPLLPFITLCFKPTMIMCLNEDLNMAKLKFKSNTIPSMFTYPEYLKAETKKEKKQLTKAVLSITAKEKARQLKRQKTKQGSSSQINLLGISETNQKDEDNEKKKKS